VSLIYDKIGSCCLLFFFLHKKIEEEEIMEGEGGRLQDYNLKTTNGFTNKY